MATYFSAAPEDINRLSPDSCAQVFGKMLKSEAFDIGIPSTAVTTTHTSVPDAGIDARVKCQSPAGGHLIVGHNPSYQIKAGETFAPWQPSEINRELFGNKEHKAENLGTETRRCFENGYTYILVCMKTHLTPARQEQALENLKRAVKECGLPAPVVEDSDLSEPRPRLGASPERERSWEGSFSSSLERAGRHEEAPRDRSRTRRSY